MRHVLLLFLGMLRELVFDALAGDAGRGDRVHRIAQHANDFGREHLLQDLDRLLDVAAVRLGNVAALQMLTRAPAQLLHVGQKRLGIFGIGFRCTHDG